MKLKLVGVVSLVRTVTLLALLLVTIVNTKFTNKNENNVAAMKNGSTVHYFTNTDKTKFINDAPDDNFLNVGNVNVTIENYNRLKSNINNANSEDVEDEDYKKRSGSDDSGSSVTNDCKINQDNIVASKTSRSGSYGRFAHEKFINFAVLLPRSFRFHPNLPALVLSAMQLAIRDLKRSNGLLTGYNISYEFADTHCSSTSGPLAAFDIVMVRKPNAFIGPMCDYVLAPVARYAGVWSIPVVTAGGIAEAFNYKNNFPTLTRMLGGYVHAGESVKSILGHFNWTTTALVYHNHQDRGSKGHSDCSLALQPIARALNDTNYVHQEFDENSADKERLYKILRYVKRNARSK